MHEEKAPKISRVDGINKIFIAKADSDEWDRKAVN